MTDDARLGEILRDGDRVGLRYERRFTHAPARVWRALTDNDGLRAWFPCALEGERAAGAELTARFWPDITDHFSIEQPALPGRILVWEPHTRFSWVWDTEELHFTLDEIDGGTQLTLTVWLGEGPGIAPAAGGYHVCLDHLVASVEHGETPSLIEADHSTVEARYVTLAEGAGLPAYSGIDTGQ